MNYLDNIKPISVERTVARPCLSGYCQRTTRLSTIGLPTIGLLGAWLALPMLLVVTACGSTPDTRTGALQESVPYEVTEDYNSGVIRYTVQRGDGLGSIAEEFTGQTSNWKEIADYNNISNPRRLREGAVIEIPTELIPGYNRPDPVPVIQTEPISSSPVPQTSSLAVRRDDAADIAPVVITPIKTNRDFELNPIDPNETQQPRTYTGTGTQIKVIGSYYPKGIYTEPAAYSKLIMRVAPGTVFSLDSQVNDWYKIQTESGIGYIRTNDAAIVE